MLFEFRGEEEGGSGDDLGGGWSWSFKRPSFVRCIVVFGRSRVARPSVVRVGLPPSVVESCGLFGKHLNVPHLRQAGSKGGRSSHRLARGLLPPSSRPTPTRTNSDFPPSTYLHAERPHAADVPEALEEHRGRGHEDLRCLQLYPDLLDEECSVCSTVRTKRGLSPTVTDERSRRRRRLTRPQISLQRFSDTIFTAGSTRYLLWCRQRVQEMPCSCCHRRHGRSLERTGGPRQSDGRRGTRLSSSHIQPVQAVTRRATINSVTTHMHAHSERERERLLS